MFWMNVHKNRLIFFSVNKLDKKPTFLFSVFGRKNKKKINTTLFLIKC
jgi:adenine-specific DNA methylase